MPGDHVVVFSGAMPTIRRGVTIPGYVYFQSTRHQCASHFEVYSQQAMKRYPVLDACHHGRVGAMTTPLPYLPSNWEVCVYYANDHGTVDCCMWRPSCTSGIYVKYEVLDIADPEDWYYGARYRFVGLHHDTPLSTCIESMGLRIFYNRMRLAA